MAIRNMTCKDFETKFMLASYWFGEKFCPAIFKQDKGGYGIRIKAGGSWRGQRVTAVYDYFALDDTGLIISSPRGLAKEYNKRVRIVDITEGVERHKTPGGQ